MGEVYKANDTRLDRAVAIKVMPEEFSRDKERIARFEREAKLLASLNHPNVATLYGLEAKDGQQFLVMELVEGETLAARLDRGPIPIDEAVALFEQIAAGLEAAHGKGVIHRDLKPANIMLTPEGTVKILDFGLAKAFADEHPPSSQTESPTVTRYTEAGVILGTAPYMSPEQARGKTVDKRSDIWAFGCVLFEALAGRTVFLGDMVSDTIARILEHDPDWSALPSKTPTHLRKLLKHCLEKDARRRLRDMGDALYELEQKEPELVPPRSSYPWRVAAGWSIPALVLGSILWVTRAGGPDTAASQSVVRFLTEDVALGVDWDTGMAMAPDGSSLAYTHVVDGVPRLFLRRLDRAEAESIPGTEDARNPFFSPDGEQVGFFCVCNDQLKKVALRGGAPVAIGKNGSGASWGPDGAIVVSEFNASLGQLPASGEPLKRVTHIEPNTNERTHRWPFVLPGGESVLFAVSHNTSASWDEAHIAVGSIETGEHRILIEGGTSPHYVTTGHIVYARAGSLHAVPFDLDRLEVTGPSVTVVDGVVMNRLNGSSHFSVSLNGTLAYRRGTIRAHTAEMLWVDREGRASPLAAPALSLIRLDLSPDGGFVALNIESAAVDVWVHDIARNITTRLTFENLNIEGVWSPDGSRLAFPHCGRDGESSGSSPCGWEHRAGEAHDEHRQPVASLLLVAGWPGTGIHSE